MKPIFLRHLLLLLLFFLPLTAIAQLGSASHTSEGKSEKRQPPKYDPIDASVGLGLGMDYGGVGVKLEVMPRPWLGLFGGGGTTLQGLGYNLGLAFRPTPNREATFVAVAMYGYNGVIVVKGQNDIIMERKTYYGPTVGAGGEFRVGRRKTNRLSLKLLIPFRDQEFYDIADAHNATYFKVTISAGFNFAFL